MGMSSGVQRVWIRQIPGEGTDGGAGWRTPHSAKPPGWQGTTATALGLPPRLAGVPWHPHEKVRSLRDSAAFEGACCATTTPACPSMPCPGRAELRLPLRRRPVSHSSTWSHAPRNWLLMSWRASGAGGRSTGAGGPPAAPHETHSEAGGGEAGRPRRRRPRLPPRGPGGVTINGGKPLFIWTFSIICTLTRLGLKRQLEQKTGQGYVLGIMRIGKREEMPEVKNGGQRQQGWPGRSRIRRSPAIFQPPST